MPATISPPGESHGCSCADSTFHFASRTCSGRPTMSASRSDASTAAIASGSSRCSVISEGEAAIGYLHAGEHTRATCDDVVGADLDTFADHRAVRGPGVRSPMTAPGQTMQSRRTQSVADLRAAQHDAALDDRARADADALGEHGEAADVRAVGDRRARARRRRAGRRARRPSPTGRRRRSRRRGARATSRADVALEDVERHLQVARGRADVDPVGVRRRRSRRGRGRRARGHTSRSIETFWSGGMRSSTERSST